MSRDPWHEAAANVSSEEYARECMGLLAKILAAAGHPKERLLRILEDVTLDVQDREVAPTELDPRFVVDLPHVLAHWHAHPRYLHRGRPKPLPFRGPGPSVTEIIKQVYPDKKPREVLQALVRSGALVCRERLYSPTSRDILFQHDRASARLHALVSCYGLLRSIDDNLSGKGPVLQRAAINSRYPVAMLPSFHKRLSTAAQEVLYSVDEFMTRRELPLRARQPYALVGFGMYGFVLPGNSRATRRTRSMAVRKQKRSTT